MMASGKQANIQVIWSRIRQPLETLFGVFNRVSDCGKITIPTSVLFSQLCSGTRAWSFLAPALKTGPETRMSNVGWQWFLMFLLVTNLETQVWGNQRKAFNLMTGNELFKKKSRLSHIVS